MTSFYSNSKLIQSSKHIKPLRPGTTGAGLCFDTVDLTEYEEMDKHNAFFIIIFLNTGDKF
jgi:hypothetical protein